MFLNDKNIKNDCCAGAVTHAHAFFQPKLSINQPNDVYEQAADHMADKVMRMADTSISQSGFFKPAIGQIQSKCPACEEVKNIHRKETAKGEVRGSDELDSYVGSLNSSGQPMPESSRKFFEPRFGRDFSNVRLHTDSVAAKSAASINALAYTAGNNIVFNSGQYSPESDSGKKLMAHELTHVVQQGSNVVRRYGHDTFCDLTTHLGPFIWPGHAEAVRMLKAVLNAFSTKDPQLNSLIPAFFGSDGLKHYSDIENAFKAINTAVNGNYTYHCNDGANKNPNPEKCHGQRATTDTPKVHGIWGSPTYDVMMCFDRVDSRYSAKEVGALIIHENYHRAFGDSNHPWNLAGDPPACGYGAPAGSILLTDNPDSYSCLAKAY
jgi:hypothetical protein